MEIQTINKNIIQNGQIPIIHDALTRRNSPPFYTMAKVPIRQVEVDTHIIVHPICLRCMLGADNNVQAV